MLLNFIASVVFLRLPNNMYKFTDFFSFYIVISLLLLLHFSIWYNLYFCLSFTIDLFSYI